MIDETNIPRFSRGVRLQHDGVRDQWVVLAPERAFIPDQTATEVLRLIDGTSSIGQIIDGLAGRFNAPREVIAGDVLGMIQDLSSRRVLRCDSMGTPA